MGNFYTNATLKGPDQRSIAKAIDRMRRVAGVAPSQNDLTVVFDRQSERQDGSAYPFVEQLTRELNCLALYVTNHDDSVLYYRLYKSGEIIDHYDSCPNYFEGEPVPPEGGNAEVLCKAFGVPAARDMVHEILHYDRQAAENEDSRRYLWEVERHGDLAKALGLPLWAVGTGYTYLSRDDWPEGLSPENIISLTGGDDRTHYLRFRSRGGMSLSAPSDWTCEEDDVAFTLFAPANAVINVFAHDRSQWFEDHSALLPDQPPLAVFQLIMVSGVLSKRESSKWKPTDWSAIVIGGHAAKKTDLIAEGEAQLRWRLYVFETKKTLCAILLEATTPAMVANAAAYEEVIRSLEGIE